MTLNKFKYCLFILSFYFAPAQVNDVFIDSLIKNEDVKFFQNLEYGDGKRNKLDLLIPIQASLIKNRKFAPVIENMLLNVDL